MLANGYGYGHGYGSISMLAHHPQRLAQPGLPAGLALGHEGDTHVLQLLEHRLPQALRQAVGLEARIEPEI